MRQTILLTILTVFIANTAFGQTTSKTSITDKFDEIANKLYSPEKPGGTILVAKEGKIIYQKAFGKANLELDVNMKVESVFRIASNTKPFTAVAILKLAEEGKLSLQDDIKKYLKNYPTHGHKITIENLLTHSSGIFNYTELKGIDELIQVNYSKEKFINLFKNKPMDFAPSTSYHYSNSAYFLLGEIIEKVSKKTYGNYLEDEFFKPLEMKNTSLDDHKKITPNRTSGYLVADKNFSNASYLGKTFATSPAGGIQSTAKDLFLWYKAVTNYKIISKESFEKATAQYKLSGGKKGKTGYSWFVGNLFGSPFITHDGSTMGYYSSLVFFPKEKVFVVALTNCNWQKEDATYFAEISHKFAALALDKDYFSDQKVIGNLNSFEAVYESATDEERRIIADGNQLFLINESGRYIPIYSYKNNQFFIIETYETLKFVKNQNGDFNSLISTISEPITFNKTNKKLPKKSLAQSLLNIILETGIDDGKIFFRKFKDSDKYYLKEAEINGAGYALLNSKRLTEAIEVFKLNAIAFPNSANAYDSLAEGYLTNKNYKMALANYQKSLKLNPKNANAEKMMKKIQEIIQKKN